MENVSFYILFSLSLSLSEKANHVNWSTSMIVLLVFHLIYSHP